MYNNIMFILYYIIYNKMFKLMLLTFRGRKGNMAYAGNSADSHISNIYRNY